MAQREVKRYSLVFKKQVVAEYEAGASISSLMKRYGIRGKQTISRWIAKYSQSGVRHKMTEVIDPHAQAELEALKDRVADLESLVAQLSLDKLMLESSLKVAEKALGYEVKKSPEPRSSNRR